MVEGYPVAAPRSRDELLRPARRSGTLKMESSA
jgi:hypothetical protein